MLKQASYFLASMLVLLAIFVAAERTSSPFFEGCINQQQDVTFVVRYVKCSGLFVERHGVGISALAAIIIAAFTCTLWLATTEQARLTRNAFIADKRAFVFAKGIQPLWELDPTTGLYNWRINAVFENSGETPTEGLLLYVDGLLSNTPIAPTFDFNYVDPNAAPGTGMLGPKAIGIGGGAPHFPRPPLTPQDILDMQTGRKFFYLWGWAKYSDTLPDTPRHITRFCWLILVTGNPFGYNPAVPNSVQFFNLHQGRGNCADNECIRQGLG